MKATINNNKTSGKNITSTLDRFVPKNARFAVIGIRARYHYDEQKRKTDAIEAHVYTMIEMETLATLDIRVDSTVPVITQEELAEAEERVFVDIPLEQTVVKPYKIEYGMATVSIVAPYITLATDAIESEES